MALPRSARPGSTGRRRRSRCRPILNCRADLCTPTWKLTARGILLKAKTKFASHLGRSPGKGDAVVMAWSEGNRAAMARAQKKSAPHRASFLFLAPAGVDGVAPRASFHQFRTSERLPVQSRLAFHEHHSRSFLGVGGFFAQRNVKHWERTALRTQWPRPGCHAGQRIEPSEPNRHPAPLERLGLTT